MDVPHTHEELLQYAAQMKEMVGLLENYTSQLDEMFDANHTFVGDTAIAITVLSANCVTLNSAMVSMLDQAMAQIHNMFRGPTTPRGAA